VSVAEIAEPKREGARFYRPELDVVRFAAFGLVFCNHLLPGDAAPYMKHMPAFAASIAANIAITGGFGVYFFFFLSAFLFADLLVLERQRTGTISIRDFYIRRTLRIWPLYATGLGIGAIFVLFQATRHAPPDDRESWLMLGMYALMVGNFFFAGRAWSSSPIGPLWSLSVEEQFYAVLPLLVKAAGRTGIFWASVSMLAIAVAVEGWLGEVHANQDTTIWTNTFVGFEFFAAGALSALWLHGRRESFSALTRLGLSACTGAAWLSAMLLFGFSGPAQNGWSVIIGYALVVAGCVALLLAVRGWTRWHPALIRLGRISYGLYVFHMPALMCVDYALVKIMPANGMFLKATLGFGLTVAAAELSYRYFETPFLRLKARFAAVRSRPI
jgi:peptidoglycan/LPS O-acetylase OafA/YrhL